jgi:hypothetical protein
MDKVRKTLHLGANPATLNYNASVGEIYSAPNSMAHFITKMIFL